MKRILLLFYCVSLALLGRSQNITAAEYFVDTDPGVGNGTDIPVTAGTTVIFNATIPTTSLAPGFHFLAIRTRGADGKWGLFENRGFYISTSTTNAADINAAEYFIDTDPGPGNGTAITVTPGTNVPFTTIIPTTSLAPGFHFLAIRTRGTDGKWGLFENRGFYISNSTTNAADINAAEYFIDTDPGPGNGTAITVTPGTNVPFSTTIPTTSLAPGFHFLAIRTRGTDGKWGLFENRGFYISTATNNAANITAAESFFDTDPGVGNGTAIPVTPGSNVPFTAIIPTTSLAPGFHFLAIRVKDADGKWGLFENRGFYISTQTTNAADMVSAEYFLDTDPGVGNGMPIPVTQSNDINQNFVLNIPSGTSNGAHFLAIRFRGTDGKWGLFEFDTITVAGTLPLNLLDFDAYKKQTSVQLKWRTGDEVNTSHFELEKSANGILFNRIASIGAANTPGLHDYAYDDLQPFTGVNFYRLKQMDIDGNFKYSQIIRVVFNSYGKPLNIYPNPATTHVQFDFAGKQKAVLVNVYDATGRQVLAVSLPNQLPLKINIEQLAKGKYMVQLSDGETVQYGSFIKQ